MMSILTNIFKYLSIIFGALWLLSHFLFLQKTFFVTRKTLKTAYPLFLVALVSTSIIIGLDTKSVATATGGFLLLFIMISLYYWILYMTLPTFEKAHTKILNRFRNSQKAKND